MSGRWHVIFAHPRWEFRVGRALDLSGAIAAFCPARRATVVSRGIKRIVEYPLLPRIVFAAWDGDDPYIWHQIKDDAHVTSILGGEFPVSLLGSDAELIDDWLARADPAWVVPGVEPIPRGIVSGDMATISEPLGLYDGITGRVLWIDGKNTCLQTERSRLVVPTQLVERVDEVVAARSGQARTRSQTRRYQRKRGVQVRRSQIAL